MLDFEDKLETALGKPNNGEIKNINNLQKLMEFKEINNTICVFTLYLMHVYSWYSYINGKPSTGSSR